MDEQSWRDAALCHVMVHGPGPYEGYMTQREMYKLYFPTRHSNGAATASAKRLCETFCPVVEQCRQHALDTGEKHGVRGGFTANDRRKIRAAVIRDLGEVDDYLQRRAS